jgi:nitric oxide reductase subunit B
VIVPFRPRLRSSASASGWPQLNAVYEHGLAYARSQAFYDTTIFWQWMRFPGDVVFALGALLMAWDFIVKLRPLYPQFIERLISGQRSYGSQETKVTAAE